MAVRASGLSLAYRNAREEQFAMRSRSRNKKPEQTASGVKTHTATTLNGDTVTITTPAAGGGGRNKSQNNTAGSSVSGAYQAAKEQNNDLPVSSETSARTGIGAGRNVPDDYNGAATVMHEETPGFGDWAGSNASAGLNQFNSGLFSTLDFVLPTELIFGEEKDPFSKLNQYYKNKLDRDTQRATRINANMGGGWDTAGQITQAVTGAVPNAALALMSGGASAGAQGAAALGTAASTGSTAFAAAQNLVKNPMFWTSMAHSTGPAYDRAKASGASELQATGAALLTGLGTSIPEVGGGLEILPGKLGTLGANALSTWGISALQEGLEEPTQSSYENLVAKALYDHDRPWYSTTDPNAVFNPIRAGSEFALGTAVGGILGGVQTGVSKAIDMNSQIEDLKRQLEAVRQDQNRAALQALYDKYVPLGFGQNKTASGTQAGMYRATRPQNVEFPTVPIINLSMDRVAQLNGGILPQVGNSLRKAAIERARTRLGLDTNSAVYIPASNVTRNGDEYVLKITRASLNKMLSPADGKRIQPESIVVLDNIERIANNGVWFEGQGDRKERTQIQGFDHLATTVYIDGEPYLVDMRVKLVQESPQSNTDNVLYFFTPEEIVSVKKADTTSPTGERRALTIGSENVPASNPIVRQNAPGVNVQDVPNGAVLSPPNPAVLQAQLAQMQHDQALAALMAEYEKHVPLPEYGSPHTLQENVEDGIIITDVSTQNDGVNAENNLKPQNLMAELANSGVKYNLNDVVMVTKTEDGTLLWLETGNSETGLIHIQNGHADNFAKRGVEDIPQALNTILKETPTLIVTNSRGIYADYMINGKEYRVTYGTNGYIVSFYPI